MAAETLGPVVRVCDNPQCGSEDSESGCSRVGPDVLMGMSMGVTPAPRENDILCAFFSRELSITYATDSHGVRRVIPDGCEFTLHKAPARVEFEGKDRGYVAWGAYYSGPAHDLDEALTGSLEWDWDTVHERYKRMRGAPDAGALR